MSEPAALHLPAHIRQRRFALAAQSAQALAEWVAHLLRQAIERRGHASLVVSGGRSPVAFLEALSEQSLGWEQVCVTLVDERWVPTDHPDSNAGMVRSALLRGAAAKARFVDLYGGQETPQAGLKACLERLSGIARPFDVVVLGMGEDGHTASLFAQSAELAGLLAPDALPAAVVHPPVAPHARISLSLPGLLHSRAIFLLISGRRKRVVMEQACLTADPLLMPVAAVLTQQRTPVEVFYGACE